MARERCDKLYSDASTCASTAPCLFYGVIFTSKAGNASLVVHDYFNITGTDATSRTLLVEQGAVTGTTPILFPMAVQLDTGLAVSLSAKTFSTLLFSKRA